MNYQAIASDLVTALRGKRTQGQVNQKLGFTFNKTYRWEAGRSSPSWLDFVDFCHACKAPLPKALRDAYSFAGFPKSTRDLVKHFIGHNKQAVVAEGIGVSRHTISRWNQGKLQPSLPQMLALMSFASMDFFRFIEILSGEQDLPSVREQLKRDHQQLNLFYKYPWLSALLSAIDLAEYRKKPSEDFLVKKSRLRREQVRAAIRDLAAAGLLVEKNGCWETALGRIGIRGSVEGRKKISDYVFSQSLAASRAKFGSANMRFSWKLFSLNKNQYENILQKYTEFFNELGTIVDAGQVGADKIYLFSTAIVDYDELPPGSSGTDFAIRNMGSIVDQVS